MRFSVLAVSALAGAAVAAPAPSPAALNFDDVIVVGEDGSYSVMKSAEYDALQAREKRMVAPAINSRSDGLESRGCPQSTEVQVLSDDTFLDWDVAMSPVLSSAGGAATVSVANGFSLANAVTVSATISTTIAQIALGVSLGVSYSKTWTTTETQTIGFTVPDGQFGLVVSQPSVRRVKGNIISGCTDTPTYSEFTSDSFSDQSYGNLNWVKGVIRLCNSTTYPVPFCNGDGSHS